MGSRRKLKAGSGDKTAGTKKAAATTAVLVAAALGVIGFPTLAAAESAFHGPTEPAKAPKGVKLAIISCSATLKGCQIPAEAAVEAASDPGHGLRVRHGKASRLERL